MKETRASSKTRREITRRVLPRANGGRERVPQRLREGSLSGLMLVLLAAPVQPQPPIQVKLDQVVEFSPSDSLEIVSSLASDGSEHCVVYLQDRVRFTRFTSNLGFRYDLDETTEQIGLDDMFSLISPRLGFTYGGGQHPRSRIYGNYGQPNFDLAGIWTEDCRTTERFFVSDGAPFGTVGGFVDPDGRPHACALSYAEGRIFDFLEAPSGEPAFLLPKKIGPFAGETIRDTAFDLGFPRIGCTEDGYYFTTVKPGASSGDFYVQPSTGARRLIDQIPMGGSLRDGNYTKSGALYSDGETWLFYHQPTGTIRSLTSAASGQPFAAGRALDLPGLGATAIITTGDAPFFGLLDQQTGEPLPFELSPEVIDAFDDIVDGGPIDLAYRGGLGPSDPYQILVAANGESTGLVVASIDPPPCVPSATTLCLNDDRFQVRVAWRTPQGTSGPGQAVELTPDTGYFYFVNSANVEMIIKVLDACGVAGRFWVFAGGLTNVEVETTVLDTATGTLRVYQNPLRTPFQPLQDTDAFACTSGAGAASPDHELVEDQWRELSAAFASLLSDAPASFAADSASVGVAIHASPGWDLGASPRAVLTVPYPLAATASVEIDVPGFAASLVGDYVANPPYQDGVDIATEIVQLELRAVDPDLGEIIVRERADRVSSGAVTDVDAAAGQLVSGRSFFAVFFEIELVDQQAVVDTGAVPLRIETQESVSSLPPLAVEHTMTGGPVPLFFGGLPVGEVNGFTLRPACLEGETVLCLGDGRFRVEVDWRTPQGAIGKGMPVQLTADTGYFWFFSPSNVEMVLKVLDACEGFDRFWVFAGGLTNVEVDVTVTDTETGAVRHYENPLRSPFQPIQDTGAFATCP
jgi:hypothetical protein